MKLQKLIIENYRCFLKYELILSPKTTILIGKNGAGKTSLVHALHNALSFIFTNDKSVTAEFLAAGNPDLKVGAIGYNDFFKDNESRTVADYVNIQAEAVFNGKSISWKMYKRSTANAGLYTSGYKDAYHSFMEEAKESKMLPVLSYYSDSFPHRNAKLSKFASDTISQEKVLRNFGYYQWDDETTCSSIWEIRFNNIWSKKAPLETKVMRINSAIFEIEETKVIDNAQKAKLLELKSQLNELNHIYAPLKNEIDFVEGKLKKFSQSIDGDKDHSFEIDYLYTQQKDNQLELNMQFTNGGSSSFQELPAGYRRLFSIIFDIAYRSYILNGNNEPSGIVIIDEIDLHLHPSLEQQVVQKFNETFPHIQFVMSTHSPLVVTNLNTVLRENEVQQNTVLYIRNRDSKAQQLFDVYGLDYNSGLVDAMETTERDPDVNSLIDSYLIYKSQGINEKADVIYDTLSKKVGDAMPKINQEIEVRLKEME